MSICTFIPIKVNRSSQHRTSRQMRPIGKEGIQERSKDSRVGKQPGGGRGGSGSVEDEERQKGGDRKERGSLRLTARGVSP